MRASAHAMHTKRIGHTIRKMDNRNPSPFEQAETHLVETMFYDERASSKESSISKVVIQYCTHEEEKWTDTVLRGLQKFQSSLS